MEDNKMIIDISARHLHLSVADKNTLFGEDYELELRPGTESMKQRPAVEKVEVIGPKGVFKTVTILCPLRKVTQFELSATDCRTLGITAPIRMSGDLKGSAKVRLKGPKGEVELTEGVIIAKRHAHVSADWAKTRDLKDGDNIILDVSSADRSLLFKDVTIRIEKDKDQVAKVHIDTDEANAAGLTGKSYGYYAGKDI